MLDPLQAKHFFFRKLWSKRLCQLQEQEQEKHIASPTLEILLTFALKSPSIPALKQEFRRWASVSEVGLGEGGGSALPVKIHPPRSDFKPLNHSVHVLAGDLLLPSS